MHILSICRRLSYHKKSLGYPVWCHYFWRACLVCTPFIGMQHSTRPVTETAFHAAGQVAQNASGNQIHASRAIKGGTYACMACKQKAVLRVGKKILRNGQTMITHFAHHVTNVIKCSGYTGGETIQHLDAKWCLADNIEDFRFIMQSCDTCNVPNTQYCVRFSKQGWTVVVEGQVAGTGTKKHPRRADVLVQMKSPTVSVRLKPWYSLEVKHSHAVSAEKTKELHGVNCGIIEVLAEDVLHFKDMLQLDKSCYPQADKPFYLRNVHTMGCIPWICKNCMELVATERAARWFDYDEWYNDQWQCHHNLMVKALRDMQLEMDRPLKRKVLQTQSFELLESRKLAQFEQTEKKCVGTCKGCGKWILHKKYTAFFADGFMTDTEQWWWDTIRKDKFLAAMYYVKKIIFCNNCVGPCLNCNFQQPIKVLEKYGLCHKCNADDKWFDNMAERRVQNGSREERRVQNTAREVDPKQTVAAPTNKRKLVSMCIDDQ